MCISISKNSKVYVLGDSISRGVILNQDKQRYEVSGKGFIDLLFDGSHLLVKNFSKFGATIKHGLSIFSKKKSEIEEEGIALLEFGGNDCDFLWSEIADAPDTEHLPNTPIQDFTKYYLELIADLRAKKIEPIILSLPPLDADRFFDAVARKLDKSSILNWLGGSTKRIYQWQEMYNTQLLQIANSANCKLVDLRQVFLKQVNPERYLCADGMHPNLEGHQLIADALRKKFFC